MMIDKKYYYLYETTNLINGKTYIGIHSWKTRFDDKYYGSGEAVKRARKKWTKDVFHVVILEYFDSRKEASDKEAIIVDEAYVNREDTYNLRIGGDNEYVHTNETRVKISTALIGHVRSEESKKKQAESMRGIKHSEERIHNRIEKIKGRHHTIEAKIKISESKKGKKFPIIICPHCGTIGGGPNMTRYHFNNCNHNTI